MSDFKRVLINVGEYRRQTKGLRCEASASVLRHERMAMICSELITAGFPRRVFASGIAAQWFQMRFEPKKRLEYSPLESKPNY